ncbi:hypothetical protein F4825DRAFT_322279 [Nemania diffusa]|nr:hypothetical protein F4825DRAFT_322279 [Nemania diffusa]
MELTPIRVRGKRRARGEQLRIAPPPKRRDTRRGQGKQPRVRREASILETSLPLELVERIFWLSENVNFPRASLRLGRLLSGRPTLHQTFLAAFAPTWEVWFGCVDGRGTQSPTIHSYVGWQEDEDRFGGNPRFQTDVLACSWATIEMILDCRDIWVQCHAQYAPFNYVPLWGDPINPSSYTGSGVTVGISNIKDFRCYFYNDYDAFGNVEYQNTFSEKEYRKEHNHETWIEVHRSTEIPDHLITGPWDEGSLQKLFWLVQAGARLSPNQTWEDTLRGFRNAIYDQDAPNFTAVRLLSILGAFREWPRRVQDEEFYKFTCFLNTCKGDIDGHWRAKYDYFDGVLTYT